MGYVDRKSKRKQTLNNTLDYMALIDMNRAFHQKAAEHTFFSSAHGAFLRIEPMLHHKACLGKFKKIEINRLFQPQCCETRNQLQEKNYKKHKTGET